MSRAGGGGNAAAGNPSELADHVLPRANRRYGRVIQYDSRKRKGYGFIQDLGAWKDTESNYVVSKDVYFYYMDIRSTFVATSTDDGDEEEVKALVKFCPGDIVEYVLHVQKNDKSTPYRALDITGIHEGPLPFHSSIITCTPYRTAMNKMRRKLRAEVAHGQAHFETVQAMHRARQNMEHGRYQDDL